MKNKISALAAALPEDSAALIDSEFNRRYFTGFPSSLGYLIVTKNDAVFLTDSRYLEKAQNTVRDARVEEFFSLDTVKDEIKKLGIARLLMQSSETTVANARLYKNKFSLCYTVFDDTLDGIITELRMKKDPNEIECIVTAQRIAEDALGHVLGIIKEGMTERELSLELDFYMLSHGAEALSFETIAISGRNTSMPHGVPTDKRIEKGDFITMDFGAVYKGYHSDMTRTVALGFADDKQREIYDTVLRAQTAAIDGIKAGVKCCDADGIARKIIEDAGYGKYFRHSTGHGVGVEIHELPNLSPKCDIALKSGMVVTAEPGIYLPEEFGVRIEDMVVVTETGCQNLTEAPKELIIL